MSNGGKGHDRRPQDVDDKTFGDNWDRIFKAKGEYYDSVKQANYADSLRLEGLMGTSSTGRATGSNPVAPSTACVGSIPTSPAIYVDDESGREVNEDFWPGDPL